jgi:magnesium transporter
MARFIKDRTASQGMGPGSLVLIGNQKMEHPVIQLMEVGEENLTEKILESIEEATPCVDSIPLSWINVWGIHDMDMMQKLGDIFSLPQLLMEDVLNTDQTPKYEEGETYDAFILKMLKYNEDEKLISAEQFTLILGDRYVVTLQEEKGDVFDPVRERIRNTKKRTRFIDTDFLAYSLLDTIVDNYILVTETIGRQIEGLEERIFGGPDHKLIEEIHKLKTELSFLRKSVRPLREMMVQMLKSESGMFQEKYMHFIRDLNELVIQATDAIELYNGMISDHLIIYSTNMTNRTNEVMKVLTIFASIFIPLTFLAGIYGMNFKFIPELSFRYSYPIFWFVVILISAGLLIYFRRKRWL